MHRKVYWSFVTEVRLIKLGHAPRRWSEKFHDMSSGLGTTPQRQLQRGTDENGKTMSRAAS